MPEPKPFDKEEVVDRPRTSTGPVVHRGRASGSVASKGMPPLWGRSLPAGTFVVMVLHFGTMLEDSAFDDRFFLVDLEVDDESEAADFLFLPALLDVWLRCDGFR